MCVILCPVMYEVLICVCVYVLVCNACIYVCMCVSVVGIVTNYGLDDPVFDH